MEPKPRTKSKKDSGWSDIKGGQAFVIPVLLLQHENFKRLSPHACKLLLDLGRQHSGANNGYLHPGFNVMKALGWRSAHTLHCSIQELLHYRIIVQTVQGGRNRPSYYGFTFRTITQKKDRPFDRPMPVIQPTNEWEQSAPPFRDKSLVQSVHKASAVGAQVSAALVQSVHQQTATCAVGAQVKPILDRALVQSVHSYSSMPYHCGEAAAAVAVACAEAVDSDAEEFS